MSSVGKQLEGVQEKLIKNTEISGSPIYLSTDNNMKRSIDNLTAKV